MKRNDEKNKERNNSHDIFFQEVMSLSKMFFVYFWLLWPICIVTFNWECLAQTKLFQEKDSSCKSSESANICHRHLSSSLRWIQNRGFSMNYFSLPTFPPQKMDAAFVAAPGSRVAVGSLALHSFECKTVGLLFWTSMLLLTPVRNLEQRTRILDVKSPTS